ncbi:MAG: AarF/UbiB family protein [Bacteroidota bacterium]|nr:AarF/UbiB family protein [Bacteroidota bacterium]
MKISRIGIAMNEIGRAREIIGVLVKFGFNDWVSKNGMGKHLVTKKHLDRISKYSKWERVRMAVEELGPTFIKFGQILADRPDIVPDDLRIELQKLQDKADPMPDDIAIREIETQLRRPIAEVFSAFDRNRLASASIAQTYRACLLNGQEVCVKIQRPGIDKKIKLDVNLMRYFAIRMQKNNPEMEAINLLGIVNEFGKTINKELDFKNEAANVIRFKYNFTGDPDIYVPKVYMELTTEKILIEEFIEGTKVSEIDTLLSIGCDPVELARKGLRLVFEQIFKHGFFHADPHPGNIFIKDKHIVVFLDYGMMGTLRPEHLQFLGQYVLGYLERDAHKITDSLLLLSGKRHFSQFKDLEFQIHDLLAQYNHLSIEEMDFGKILSESVDIIVHYGLKIPSGIYLLVKSLLSIERVAITLYPEIDFANEMKPYASDLIWEQFNPKRIASEVFDSIKEYYQLIRDFPSEINDIIYKVKEGRFKTLIEVKGFDPLVEHIDKSSNRVSIAIVLAALIIGASIISQWEHTRWLGTIVFIFAGILGFLLVIQLFRKSKL